MNKPLITFEIIDNLNILIILIYFFSLNLEYLYLTLVNGVNGKK